MQIKKIISYIVIILLQFLISCQVIAQNNFDEVRLEKVTMNFISKNSNLRIFNLYIKIHKITEKLDKNSSISNKFAQLLFIESILKKCLDSIIENNSNKVLISWLEQILTSKNINIKDLKILKITKIEDKTYTLVNRIFNKFQIKLTNNWVSYEEILNLYYNSEIWVYYRPQEDLMVNNYVEKDIIINLRNKKISWTVSYNPDVLSQNLVILNSWAGNNDRDFFESRHRINFVLSKNLNKNWYATFRYDKTWIESSTWDNFINLTTEDLASDLDWIVEYFRNSWDIRFNKIWLLGHSEWWIISSIVANKRKDINFLVLLSTPYASLEQLLKDGSVNFGLNYTTDNLKLRVKTHIIALADIMKTAGSNEDLDKLINNYFVSLNLEDKLIFTAIESNFSFGSVNDLSSKWLKNYLTLDIKNYLKWIKIPILVINWNKDFLVDSNKLWDIVSIIKPNNNKSDLIILNNTWHMLEKNTTWKNKDYSLQSETINKDWLDKIKSWLKTIDN